MIHPENTPQSNAFGDRPGISARPGTTRSATESWTKVSAHRVTRWTARNTIAIDDRYRWTSSNQGIVGRRPRTRDESNSPTMMAPADANQDINPADRVRYQKI